MKNNIKPINKNGINTLLELTLAATKIHKIAINQLKKTGPNCKLQIQQDSYADFEQELISNENPSMPLESPTHHDQNFEHSTQKPTHTQKTQSHLPSTKVRQMKQTMERKKTCA